MRGETADGEHSLRDGINFAVRTEKRRDEQRATQQIGSIAQCADRYVNACSVARKGRQNGGDHNCGNVLRVDIGIACVDAEALQHRNEALLCENRVCQPVTGTIEANDQAVPKKHIGANALELDNILDARSGFRAVAGINGNRHHHNQCNRACKFQKSFVPVHFVIRSFIDTAF